MALLLDCPAAVRAAVTLQVDRGYRLALARVRALLRSGELAPASAAAWLHAQCGQLVLGALAGELGDAEGSSPLHAAAALGAEGALAQLLMEGAAHLGALLRQRDARGRTPAQVAAAAAAAAGEGGGGVRDLLEALEAALQTGEGAREQQQAEEAAQRAEEEAAEARGGGSASGCALA